MTMKQLAFSTALGAVIAVTGMTPAPAQQASADPEAIVNAFEGAFGKHAARRSFAKGVCFEGSFSPSREASGLSSASTFAGAPVALIGRFSVGGGNPRASDKARSVRGLAISFDHGGRNQWDMANISAPFFFVSTPENFLKFLEARRADPATGRPDPQRIAASNASLPDTKPQIDFLAANPIPGSYAGIRYFGVNAFRFVNAQGQTSFVRWEFEPGAGLVGLTDAQLQALPDDFLADDIRRRVAAGPVTFTMVAQIAQQGDVLDNATVAWPAERRRVTLGTVRVTTVEPGSGGRCDQVTFDPLILPSGIEPSADPILNARSIPYAISLSRRLSN